MKRHYGIVLALTLLILSTLSLQFANSTRDYKLVAQIPDSLIEHKVGSHEGSLDLIALNKNLPIARDKWNTIVILARHELLNHATDRVMVKIGKKVFWVPVGFKKNVTENGYFIRIDSFRNKIDRKNAELLFPIRKNLSFTFFLAFSGNSKSEWASRQSAENLQSSQSYVRIDINLGRYRNKECLEIMLNICDLQGSQLFDASASILDISSQTPEHWCARSPKNTSFIVFDYPEFSEDKSVFLRIGERKSWNCNSFDVLALGLVERESFFRTNRLYFWFNPTIQRTLSVQLINN